MRFASTIALLPLLSACSVGMAMHGEPDPDLGGIKPGAHRSEVELQLGPPVQTATVDGGLQQVVYEYTIGNAPSAGRAAGHAAMDVLTLGIWELVGTPIEGFAGDSYRMTVTYDELERVSDMRTAKSD